MDLQSRQVNNRFKIYILRAFLLCSSIWWFFFCTAYEHILILNKNGILVDKVSFSNIGKNISISSYGEYLASANLHSIYLYKNNLSKLNSQKRNVCPNCNNAIESDWVKCPNCKENLKPVCLNCGFGIEIEWDACPKCGNEL